MKKNFLKLVVIFFSVMICFCGCKKSNKKNDDLKPQTKNKTEIAQNEEIEDTEKKYIPNGQYYGIDEYENMLEVNANELEENNFDIDLSIYRLASMDGTGIINAQNNVIETNLTDPNGNNLKAEIVYDEEMRRIRVIITESQWEYLKNGTEFIFDARNYPVDTETAYDLLKNCTGYAQNSDAINNNTVNAFNMIEFMYKTRFCDLDNDDLHVIFSEAYKKLSKDQKNEFDKNFDRTIRPMVINIFSDIATVRQDLYNAGVHDKLQFYINYNERFNISSGFGKLVDIYYDIKSNTGK